LKARKLKSIEKRTFGYENFFYSFFIFAKRKSFGFGGNKFFEGIKA
jgi:hypothetical protein